MGFIRCCVLGKFLGLLFSCPFEAKLDAQYLLQYLHVLNVILRLLPPHNEL